jgi:voltage-gated potassium channel
MGLKDLRSRSWWVVAMAGVRALLAASVLIAMYYLLPLDASGSDLSAVVRVVLGILAFAAVMAWQLRAIANSGTPGLRALEGLFLAIPLFLLLFASTHFLLSEGNASSYTSPLTRTDALYFTVTIFSTVGFGDISPRTETARLITTAQMIIDLIILGAGVRIILGAVQRGRERQTTEPSADPARP